MNSIPLVVNNPGTFTYTEGQTYYNELLAHSILEHGYLMSQEGYEITWEDADIFSYTALWTKQTASLFGLVDALNGQGADTLLQNYFETLARELNELTTLEYRRENYELRAKMIAVGEKALALNSAGTLELPQPLQISIPEAVQVQRVYPEFPEAIWHQQTAALQQQSALLSQVKTLLQEKYEELPEETEESGFIAGIVSSLLEEGGVEAFYTGLKWLLSWLSGSGGFLTSIMAFCISAAFFYFRDLAERYLLGKDTCDQMLLENQHIETISIYAEGSTDIDAEKAWEYFGLREKVILRHQNDIHNMLTEIMTLEKQASETFGTPKDTNDMTELIQAVKDLQFNGLEFVYKDGSKYRLDGQIPAGTA